MEENRDYPSLVTGLMKKRRLTRESLAAALGVPKGLIKRWEECRLRPQSQAQTEALAELLGCTPEELEAYFAPAPSGVPRTDRRFRASDRPSPLPEHRPRPGKPAGGKPPIVAPAARASRKRRTAVAPDTAERYRDFFDFGAVTDGEE